MSTQQARMIQTLRQMLHDVLALRSCGVAYARQARAHGYVDGYMRALLDAGLFDNAQLLAIVAETRKEVDGPATGEVKKPERVAA